MSGQQRRGDVPGRRRVATLVACAAAVAVAAGAATSVVTAAAFRDSAVLNLGDDGLGSEHVFGLVLVDDEGTVRTAPAEAPLRAPVAGADLLVPGVTLEVPLTVANNHPVLRADLVARVTGDVVPGTADLTPYLRYLVLDADGRAAQGRDLDDPGTWVAVGEASPGVGVLAGRGSAPLAPGEPWVAGVDGSAADVTVLVHLVDAPGTEALNGGRVRLTVEITGESVG
ncbi:hypothetical protein [Cellulomonas triticagri]|uniref:Uncharacterized protein n=1 Tax=Cellulomonas triticagri TaxID=2483352 RepID=A0A3M2J972_9CELL|nr:hypothetical protein [Cellulomonas triticagri]RMI07028.1 hypothetical protein EBM89_14120 [Cellulomonas triticagri]